MPSSRSDERPAEARPWDASTLTTHLDQLEAHRAATGRAYLVVLGREMPHVVELPAEGEVRIGRGSDSHLRITESWVSRNHAAIRMRRGEASLRDLDSHNGTFVNGERVTGERVLAPGDLIAVCSVTIAFHKAETTAEGERVGTVIELAELRRRAEIELERTLRYGRPLSVLSVTLGKGADRARVENILGCQLRLIDVPAWGGPGDLVVLLPEADAAAARGAAARMQRVLAPAAPGARVGVATSPVDGAALDPLLARAHAASAAADTSPAAAATSGAVRIGDRQVVVADPAMARLYSLVERLAASQLPVLVFGETGTGKELVATAIHEWSTRRQQPLVALNCAAIHESLVESELFGYERGAFSGAVSSKVGLFESASGGTLFLDEIGDLPIAVQAKLLRVLETRRLVRLGDVREREVDARIVAATNRNLEDEVRAGRFRRDLFFRLSGATLWLPPLRQRPRELAGLAEALLAEACARARRPPMVLSHEAVLRLQTHEWPGNVRELKHLADYLAATLPEVRIEASHVDARLGAPDGAKLDGATDPGAPLQGADAPPGVTSPALPAFRPIEEELRALERRRMAEALKAAGGNQSAAAELIGMPRRTFVAKLRQYDLPRGRSR